MSKNKVFYHPFLVVLSEFEDYNKFVVEMEQMFRKSKNIERLDIMKEAYIQKIVKLLNSADLGLLDFILKLLEKRVNASKDYPTSV